LNAGKKVEENFKNQKSKKVSVMVMGQKNDRENSVKEKLREILQAR
jgi:hypothetical protein